MNSNFDTGIYEIFAEVYDATMQGVPFYQWAYSIFKISQEYRLPISSKVIDLGCGTATVTRHLATYFSQIFALDRSFSMLKKAWEKNRYELSGKIHLIQGDFCSLPLKKNMFHLAISTHDSVNYITSKNDLRRHFEEVHSILKRNGIYIFDITSEQNVEKNFHKKIFKEIYSNLFFIWENIYKKEEKMILSFLRFYNISVESRFHKMIQKLFPLVFQKRLVKEEIHYQKIYSHDEILLAVDGLFKIEKIIADYVPEKEISAANIIVYVIQKIG